MTVTVSHYSQGKIPVSFFLSDISPCNLKTELSHPALNLSFRCGHTQPFTREHLCSRTCFLKDIACLAHTASARCGEGNNGLSREIIALEEGMDDAGSLIPPDWIINCSLSPQPLVNAGFNAIQNCVLCVCLYNNYINAILSLQTPITYGLLCFLSII